MSIPPAIPLLPGRPVSYSQSPVVSYRPAVAITDRTARQVSSRTTRRPLSGLTPPSARVAPMTARSLAVTARQQVRVYSPTASYGSPGSTPALCSRTASARLRSFVARADSRTGRSSASLRPANADSPARAASHRCEALPPGSEATVTRAPALTIGLVRPSGLASTAVSESNGRPVALTPTSRRAASAPETSHSSANVNGLTTLITGNGTSASPAAADTPDVLTTARPKRSGSAAASAG